jgi:hypothetical protein
MIRDWKEKTFEKSYIDYILIGTTIFGQVTFRETEDIPDRDELENNPDKYTIVIGDTVLGYSTKRDDLTGWDFHVSIAICSDGIWIAELDDRVDEIKNELLMHRLTL